MCACSPGKLRNIDACVTEAASFDTLLPSAALAPRNFSGESRQESQGRKVENEKRAARV
jgi:hypothetical protein